MAGFNPFGLFGNNAQPPAPAPAPAPATPAPAQEPPPAAQQAAPTAVPPPPAPAPSPADKYADLWDTTNTLTPASFEGVNINIDPTKIAEGVKGLEFTKVVTPELQAKIAAGGAEGVAATMQALNTVAQLSHAQSVTATANIVKEALAEQAKQFKEALPGILRQHGALDTATENHPLMSNPAFAPVVQTLATQFTTKFPNASKQEIRDHVNGYLGLVAEQMGYQKPAPAPASQSRRTVDDWATWLQS